MQHAQGQFTPEQMIAAGRRAEAQGQPGHALQFYQYIAETYPHSTEAYEARDAIYRLTDPHAHAAAAQQAQPMAAPIQAQHPHAQAHAQSAATMTDVRPTRDVGGEAGHAPPQTARTKAARRRRAEAVEEDDEHDAPRSGYRIGRFVAAMLSTMGWLMLLGGLVAVPLLAASLTVKAVPKGLREAVASNLIAVGGITFGAIFLGLFALFAAQTARAAFDTADAVQELLAQRGAANHDS